MKDSPLKDEIMALPQLASADDIRRFVSFLSRKPAGATVDEAVRAVESVADRRRLAAYEYFEIATKENGKYKLTDRIGRALARASDGAQFSETIRRILTGVPAYFAFLERAFESELDTISTSEVGSFWHDHFRDELGTENEKEIANRAVCFLQLTASAGLGEFVTGRRGQSTRVVLDQEMLRAFLHSERFDDEPAGAEAASGSQDRLQSQAKEHTPSDKPSGPEQSCQSTRKGREAIFIGHGKHKEAVKELEKILGEFKIPFKVVMEEPNLGRPIGGKVRETLDGCNCAILIFTCDEEFQTPAGETVWRPSENVIHELGAASYLYGERIVILKEDGINLPSNVRELGHISFKKDQLAAKTMDILKELIGFGIVKFTT